MKYWVNAKTFLQMLETVKGSRSKETNLRYVLSGALVRITKNDIKVISTDSERLTVTTFTPTGPGNPDFDGEYVFCLSDNDIAMLEKNIKTLRKGALLPLDIHEGHKIVTPRNGGPFELKEDCPVNVSIDGTWLYLELSDGNIFPDYERVIPERGRTLTYGNGGKVQIENLNQVALDPKLLALIARDCKKASYLKFELAGRKDPILIDCIIDDINVLIVLGCMNIAW